jgi:hypothetical protein
MSAYDPKQTSFGRGDATKSDYRHGSLYLDGKDQYFCGQRFDQKHGQVRAIISIHAEAGLCNGLHGPASCGRNEFHLGGYRWNESTN